MVARVVGGYGGLVEGGGNVIGADRVGNSDAYRFAYNLDVFLNMVVGLYMHALVADLE